MTDQRPGAQPLAQHSSARSARFMEVFVMTVLVGCSRSATGIVVEVHSDIDTPFTNVHLEMSRGTTTGTPFFRGDYLPVANMGTLLGSLSVAAPSAGDSRLFVHVEGTLGTSGVVTQNALVSFTPQHVLLLRMDLPRSCLDVRCDPSETCENARCVAVALTTLPDYTYRPDASIDTPPAPDAGFDATPALALTNVLEIAAGGGQTCAVKSDGIAYCWGANDQGQLGDGTKIEHVAPARVSLPSPAVRLSVGTGHACALGSSGQVWCWGLNTSAQLGSAATMLPQPQPTLVAGLTGIGLLDQGSAHGCAARGVAGSQTLQCWGYNAFGQVGDNSTVSPRQITLVAPGFATIDVISAGDTHTCAMGIGRVSCWGNNTRGQVGNGQPGLNVITPTFVSPITGGTDLSSGGGHTCVVERAVVQCWGDNSLGSLGNGTTTNASVPTPVPSLGTVVEVEAGYHHTCARLSNGTVYCWGDNTYGQLGVGSTATMSTQPVQVMGITTAAQLTTGLFHTCARLTDGTVRCWGLNNHGQLGDGTLISQSVPVSVIR